MLRIQQQTVDASTASNLPRFDYDNVIAGYYNQLDTAADA